jgi:hypothetical protein
MIVLLKHNVDQMAKDIVRLIFNSFFYLEKFCFLDWRIHELAERDFEQGRFRRRRYRQQIRQLQMHSSPYETQSFYPPSNSYYINSPPPSYHTIYPTPNSSMNPGESSYYDPYSTSYYPMALSYASPNESAYFDA